MKRYIYILCAACLALVSCDKTVIDGELPSDVAGNNSIEVLRSSLILSPDASEGYVIVKADGEVTAQSDRDWCTVEVFGDSVAVKTTSNYNHLDSRYAQVILTDNVSKLPLNVHQSAPLTKYFDESGVVLGHEGGDAEFSYKSNMKPVVTSSVAWATAEVGTDAVKVHIENNASKEYRAGELSCKLGNETFKVVVAQFEAADILSNKDWKIDGVLLDGTELPLTGTITKAGDKYTMALSGTGISWSFPVTVSGNLLNIPLGSSIGRYSADERNYYVFPVVADGAENGEASSMSIKGDIGFSMSKDSESGKWQGTLNLQPFEESYSNPVFRFEFWRTAFKMGVSSGGFRFKELTITQQ